MYLKQVPPPVYKLTNYLLLSHFYFKICMIHSKTPSIMQQFLDFSALDGKFTCSTVHWSAEQGAESAWGRGQGPPQKLPEVHFCCYVICAKCLPACMKGPFCCHYMTSFPSFLKWFFWPPNLQTKWWFGKSRAHVFWNVHHHPASERGKNPIEAAALMFPIVEVVLNSAAGLGCYTV